MGKVHRDAPSIQEVAPSSAGQIRQMTHNGWTPLNRVLLGEQSIGRAQAGFQWPQAQAGGNFVQ